MICQSKQGILGSREYLTSELTIPANDEPFGVFILSERNRPISVSENQKGL